MFIRVITRKIKTMTKERRVAVFTKIVVSYTGAPFTKPTTFTLAALRHHKRRITEFSTTRKKSSHFEILIWMIFHEFIKFSDDIMFPLHISHHAKGKVETAVKWTWSKNKYFHLTLISVYCILSHHQPPSPCNSSEILPFYLLGLQTYKFIIRPQELLYILVLHIHVHVIMIYVQ